MKDYLLSGLFIYDLSGNELTKLDIRTAHERNLMFLRFGDEVYLVGDFNGILDYLQGYIGVEVVNEYLEPLKKAYANFQS